MSYFWWKWECGITSIWKFLHLLVNHHQPSPSRSVIKICFLTFTSFSGLLAQFLCLLVNVSEVPVFFAGSTHTCMHLWARVTFHPWPVFTFLWHANRLGRGCWLLCPISLTENGTQLSDDTLGQLPINLTVLSCSFCCSCFTSHSVVSFFSLYNHLQSQYMHAGRKYNITR